MSQHLFRATRLREAFNELAPGTQAEIATVRRSASPVTAPTTEQQIDNDRLQFQDEYVEWRAERQNGVRRVTFTTESTDISRLSPRRK